MAACGANDVQQLPPNYAKTVQIENEGKEDIQVVVTFEDEKVDAEKSQVKAGTTWTSTLKEIDNGNTKMVIPVNIVTASIDESLSEVKVAEFCKDKSSGIVEVLKLKAVVKQSGSTQNVVLEIVL